MHELFLSCDWGTTYLRLRLVEAEGCSIVSSVNSKRGAFVISEAGQSAAKRAEVFERALAEAAAELREATPALLSQIPIVISGMASSSIGWREVPYALLPFRLSGRDLSWTELPSVSLVEGGASEAYLISGLRSENDIMRGEETELLGIFCDSEYSALREHCLVLLPGTHSKHIEVRDGTVEEFRTFMTGELYEVMGTESVLRHSVVLQHEMQDSGKEAFLAGLRHAGEGALSHVLFKVRANQVLSGSDHGENAHFLSGLLIGSELLDCRGRLGTSHPIILRAPARLRRLYTIALEELGFEQLFVVSDEEAERVTARAHHLFLQEVR